MNKKLVYLMAAAAIASALLVACQARTPRAMPTPTRSAAPARSSSPARSTAPAKVPSVPAGKTASQDTKGAQTTIPEEANIGD